MIALTLFGLALVELAWAERLAVVIRHRQTVLRHWSAAVHRPQNAYRWDLDPDQGLVEAARSPCVCPTHLDRSHDCLRDWVRWRHRHGVLALWSFMNLSQSHLR